MYLKNTILTYPFLLLLSTGKRSFENLGRLVHLSGRAIANLLPSAENSIRFLQNVCVSVFYGKKKLYLIIDDTLIKKIYATRMQGSCSFFDTKIGRSINAFKLATAMISDGKYSIPIAYAYLFSKEIIAHCEEKFETKDEIVQSFVNTSKRLFPHAKIVVAADGLYATVNFLTWAVENKIPAELRMHSNRIVLYKGRRMSVKELSTLKKIRLTGRRRARTVSVVWHGLSLELTIVKRTDKHGNDSIVFQIATYKAEPREHVKAYKIRWNTEMLNRTTKQYIGLGDCFSKKFSVQKSHTAAALLAYALAQVEKKVLGLKNAEHAIRAIKEKFLRSDTLESVLLHESFRGFDA